MNADQLEVLGVASCPTCNKRFRLLKKHEPFIGKQIKCPNCQRPFVVQVEAPTPIEKAAIANATAPAEAAAATDGDKAEKPKKKRRTKAEIHKDAYAEIRSGFRPFLRRLRAIADAESSSEEQIRVWCLDVLRSVLGYEDHDLDTEMTTLNQRIDIAVKHDGKVIMIVECKNVRARLSNNHRVQAVMYAASVSADWAVVTNGQEWCLLRVIPMKGRDPQVVEVFSISLLDEDGLSPYDVERMYLLTQRALLRGYTEKEFHRARCLDNLQIVKALSTDRIIATMRKVLIKSYRTEHGTIVKLRNDDVAECLQELTRPSEL